MYHAPSRPKQMVVKVGSGAVLCTFELKQGCREIRREGGQP